MKSIVVFASGNGTNAERIFRYFSSSKSVQVSMLISNKQDCGAIDKARAWGIPCRSFTKEVYEDGHSLLKLLDELNPSAIVLAGFLWFVPIGVLSRFAGKIINIHPSLLPKYGGKGMYGDKVHQAVLDAHEKESGFTIHLVNERFDEGKILHQEKCQVSELDTVSTLSRKVLELEHAHYPAFIANFVGQE